MSAEPIALAACSSPNARKHAAPRPYSAAAQALRQRSAILNEHYPAL